MDGRKDVCMYVLVCSKLQGVTPRRPKMLSNMHRKAVRCWSSGWDLNLVLPKYKNRYVTGRPKCRIWINKLGIIVH